MNTTHYTTGNPIIQLITGKADQTIPNIKIDTKVIAGNTEISSGNQYGIAAGSSLTSLDDKSLEARIAGIRQSGARWIRFDFGWDVIQPSNSKTFNWTTYDKIVALTQKYKLNVLGIITNTPSWARASSCSNLHCPPADNSQFASFAQTVANRYEGSGVNSWEIWNEPNNPQFWAPSVNVASYTDLLKKTYVAIHNTNASAVIVTGGLSPQSDSSTSKAPVTFLQALYANGAKGYFDAVADHPYTFPLSPTSKENHAWNQMAASTNSMRSTMVSNGDGNKKIWITEFGSPTGGPGPIATVAQDNLSQHPYRVDNTLQAKILSDAIGLYKSYDWAGPFMYYSYIDSGTSQDTNENFFGLLTNSGAQKPAYSVFQSAANGG